MSSSETPAYDPQQPGFSGLACLCSIAAYYRVPADPARLKHELALIEEINFPELIRAAKWLGFKARRVQLGAKTTLESLPTPSILKSGDSFLIMLGIQDGAIRVADPIKKETVLCPVNAIVQPDAEILLIGRRLGGAGFDPATFNLYWFAPAFWKYRKPLLQVMISSLFVQIFALITPLFFQVVIDKVLNHRGYSTLYILVVGLALLGLFDVMLQYLRTYTLAHTTNRIDVELGRRLFAHFLRLPIGYSETRAAGQTVARIRELENVRGFLSEKGVFGILDLLFSFVSIGVLFAYSWRLALIVVCTIPCYVLVSFLFRPLLRDAVKEKFARGAESQQFLVETVIGIQTVKAAAVEPIVQSQWEDKLAYYVNSAFRTTLLSAKGQSAIQYINKFSSALLLLFGAKAVLDGELSVGGMVAFNMISGQVAAPVIRLSQIWQDFQQVQVSVERLGDILNAPMEPLPGHKNLMPSPQGAIEFKNVTFRYRENGQSVLKDVSLKIRPGEVLGVVGPSGSGKSTLTKLIQRFYAPNEGSVLIDGVDLAHVDPGWLRRNIGVVLQENLLFNRTIHENIALSDPALPRPRIVEIAKLAGADEFISKLPNGYDTVIEERGANLSGGQRQRIAIARALASNPPILILDEATSALDYISEAIIQNNMKQISRDRTVIIIAHRLAAIRPCHRIIGMLDGQIVEQGTHDQLIAKKGLYAKLWAIQESGGME